MLAAIVGLIPMVVVLELGSEQYALLACVMLQGLTVSCMVTLFLVPTAHHLIHRKDVGMTESNPDRVR
jgi:Cu/Ag efflux pump CusA